MNSDGANAIEPARIVFAGTPDFAVPSLAALVDAPNCEVVAVYTQPDRRAGRGRQLRASPVKAFALEHGLAVEQPETLRAEAAREQLRSYRPDLMIVAAYGLLLPQDVLDIPRLGCLNVHASLLPRWRGAAPVQYAIAAGDTVTGITLMQMEAGLDTGDMIAVADTPIGRAETGGELTGRLAQLGAQLLAATLPAIAAGTVDAQPQDEALVTHAPKIRKADGVIDWNDAAGAIARTVRAFNPWPVAQTTHDGELLRIWAAEPSGKTAQALPGTVLACSDNVIDVATGNGVLRITELQRAGSRRMSAREYLNAGTLEGAKLGDERAC